MSKFMINNDCCNDQPGDDNEGKDCLDKWRDEKEKVCIDYDKAAAQTKECYDAYSNSSTWESKIENWGELIKESDDKAKEIIVQLDFFLAQVRIVCEKAACTNDALEKLTCLIKSIFNTFFYHQNGVDGLKELIINLKKAVDCLKNVGDDEKAEVIKCIEVYEEKIKEVCVLQEDLLCKLIETMQCANLLYAWICEQGGLKDKLIGIRMSLDPTGSDMDEDCKPDTEEHPKDEGGGSGEPKYPCDDAEAKPVPEFPISESTYYKSLDDALEIAVEKTEIYKSDWMNSKKTSDGLLSKKESLIEAIKAAETAEGGK